LPSIQNDILDCIGAIRVEGFVAVAEEVALFLSNLDSLVRTRFSAEGPDD
jgi:hypothetical protein